MCNKKRKRRVRIRPRKGTWPIPSARFYRRTSSVISGVEVWSSPHRGKDAGVPDHEEHHHNKCVRTHQTRPLPPWYYAPCAPVVLEPHPVRELRRRLGSVTRNLVANTRGVWSTGFLVTGNFVLLAFSCACRGFWYLARRDARLTRPLVKNPRLHATQTHATSCKPSVPRRRALEHDIHPEPLRLQPKPWNNPPSPAISFSSSLSYVSHARRGEAMRCRGGMTSTPPIVKLNIDCFLPLTPDPSTRRSTHLASCGVHRYHAGTRI
jgi:hypothetical protein